MKTKLPSTIATIKEAQNFLLELHANGEQFHPEDNAIGMHWGQCEPPTADQEVHLNKLMQDIYALPGNDGDHANPDFDPCLYLLAMDKKDMVLSTDEEKFTLLEYITENDWYVIKEALPEVLDLERGNEITFQSQGGNTTIKCIGMGDELEEIDLAFQNDKTSYAYSSIEYLDETYTCREIPDLESEGHTLTIAPLALLEALQNDYGRRLENCPEDDKIAYYAPPEELLLTDAELYKLTYQ